MKKNEHKMDISTPHSKGCNTTCKWSITEFLLDEKSAVWYSLKCLDMEVKVATDQLKSQQISNETYLTIKQSNEWEWIWYKSGRSQQPKPKKEKKGIRINAFPLLPWPIVNAAAFASLVLPWTVDYRAPSMLHWKFQYTAPQASIQDF